MHDRARVSEAPQEAHSVPRGSSEWSWAGAAGAAAMLPPPPLHAAAAPIAADLAVQAAIHANEPGEGIALAQGLMHLNPGLVLAEEQYEHSLSVAEC
jgi:hypothetical protein